MKTIKKIRRLLFVGTFLLFISACGWQLRGFNQGDLPSQLALATSDPYAPLARQLQQTLVRRGATISSTAPIKLWLDEEQQEKRTVAVTTIGSAAQYELRLEVAYTYTHRNSPKELPIVISSQRVFDFIPGSNLAKVEEERTLLKEMRQELINRILAAAPKDKASKENKDPRPPGSLPRGSAAPKIPVDTYGKN